MSQADPPPRRRTFRPETLETFLSIDRHNEVAAAMARGQKPPADLVLEELHGLRLFGVGILRKVGKAIRDKASREKIKDEAALVEPMMWQLECVRQNAPNVMTYILERWPSLEERVNAVFAAYVVIADHYDLRIGERPSVPKKPLDAKALAELDKTLDDLDFSLDLYANLIERYGVETTDSSASQADQVSSAITEQGLNRTEEAVLSIIKAQPKGHGINGKEIVKKLKEKGITLAESSLRKHILPKLAEKHSVVNHRAAGGYLIL